MSRRKRNRSDREDEPVLFDLPLDPPAPPGPAPEHQAPEEAAAPEEAEARERDGEAAPGMLSLFDEREIAPARAAAPEAATDPPAERHRATRPRPVPVPDPPDQRDPRDPLDQPGQDLDRASAGAPRAERVTLASRYLAGLADLAVHAAVVVLLLLGARLLGVPAGFGDWPALVVFLLTFSFLYSILPLAFWSQTPGMAWAGLVARAPGDVSLTFGQTARRWLGGLLTVALLGLPTLLAAAGGRSLADRLSGSHLSVN